MRAFIIISLAFILMLACTGSTAEPASEDSIKEALNNRSFRQFEPSVDAEQRKAVILDFRNGIRIWAQYAEGDYAEKEWEISAGDYSVLRGGGWEYELLLAQPMSRQALPTECEDCIDVAGVSVSVRGLDEGSVSFRINDPEGSLPLPFPVFNGWTTFQEDEYVN